MQEMTRDIYNMCGQAFGIGVQWCLVAERQNFKILFSSMNLIVEKSKGVQKEHKSSKESVTEQKTFTEKGEVV